MVDVAVAQLGVDVDVVGVEDLRVVEWFQDGLLENVREERVFVGGLVAADEGLQTLLFAQQPVKEAGAGLANVYSAGDIDGLVEGKLHPLDQVEGDCVLKTAVYHPSARPWRIM